MSYVTQETIDRVTNVLLRGSYQMKQAVLRETPINPPNGRTSMFAQNQITQDFSKLKITNVSDMICFIKFGVIDRDQIGAMTFITKYPHELTTVASRIGWIPCWFLPWTSGHIIKLKIKSFATDPVLNFGNGIDPVANPDLFFTAGINGCSVFAVGAADAPSMYHGGINPGSEIAMPLQVNEITETAWRRLLGRGATVKFVGSVGKHDYITELVDPNTTDDTNRYRYNNFKTTRLAADLEGRLTNAGQLTRIVVSPWGAVFGLRNPTTDNWSMTLVKNSTLVYRRIVISVKKRILRSDKIITEHRGEIRGAQGLGRTADGLADLTQNVGNLSEMDISRTINLGYSEFFPGGGVTSIRNININTIY